MLEQAWKELLLDIGTRVFMDETKLSWFQSKDAISANLSGQEGLHTSKTALLETVGLKR